MTTPQEDDNAAPIFPRRSCLYMPGTNVRAHEKAKGLSTDVLIFDLEDSVAPDAKADARNAIIAALKTGGYGRRELVGRVNGFDTPWGEDDIRAIAGLDAGEGAHAVLIPKVEDPATVRRAGDLLDAAGGDTRLWSMMETARGVLGAAEIAAAHERLDMFTMGLEDLAKELHADNSGDRLAMLYALEHSVMAARAYGLGILDGVYPAFDDADGFQAVCEQGRRLGFDGKQLIHPRQIDPANVAFSPSPDAVSEARRMIDAFEQAEASGEGITVLDGAMVEALHVVEAKQLVAFADAISALETESTNP
ncbi:MAG: CoA ester lyase [Rhodospirillales bacterium]|nr:CoA ester lyase [Rhodospirillales bacterium]